MEMNLTRAAVIAISAALAAVTPARAADGPYELERSNEYVWVGTGAGLLLGGVIGLSKVAPFSSDEIAAFHVNDVNSFDRRWMQPYHEDHAGDALALGSYLFPLAFYANSDTRRDMDTLTAMWAEATLVNLGIDRMVKLIARRPRPYLYDPAAPASLKESRSARRSFYSGHSASASLNSFFMARVFSDYTDNRDAEIALWSGAVIYPALTAFCRMDSGHHFTTDAIVGYAVGAAIGCLVPILHRRADNNSTAPAESASGISFSLSFSF